MTKIEQIKDAITKAANGYSKLTYEILDLPSFSSHKIKHLLNNLGEIGTRYFEIGLHKAGTFIAASYGNNMISFGVDNFTEFEQGGLSRKLCFENIKKYLGTNNAEAIDADCFGLDRDTFFHEMNGQEVVSDNGTIDFYLYDGNHSDWAQKKALTHFYPCLADEFIFCVDDTSWESVIKGTKEGIEECGLKVLFEQMLWDNIEGGEWHNGFTVWLLKK